MTEVNRKKQLQRLKPAEDERKLQTKRFVELCVETERLKPLLENCGINRCTALTEKSGLFLRS